MPPPEPPSVNEGRITTGKPRPPAPAAPPPCECASVERGQARPMRVIACLNFSRSSALSIASREAPIISTPYFSSTPSRARSSAQLSAGLPAHGRQQRVRALLRDDARDHLPGDRLDVGGVGHLRVGHDRRRVGVDQDDLVALLAQRLARLRAGIVELAGLADDDRAGADDQDALDVGAFWHAPSISFAKRSNR